MLVRNPDPTSMTDNAQSLFIYFLAKKKKIERGFFVPINKDSLEERKQIYLKTYINTYTCTYIKVCQLLKI